MSKDFTFKAGEVTLKVEGLRDTIKSLEKSGTSVDDLKDLMASLSLIVIQAASPPVQSGSLSGSMRPGRAKNRAVIRAGTAAVPYAGPIHYGWLKRNIRPQPFLDEALQKTYPEILEAFDNELSEIFKRNKLE